MNPELLYSTTHSLGIHLGAFFPHIKIDAETRNCAFNLPSPRFKLFARRAILPRMISEALKNAWDMFTRDVVGLDITEDDSDSAGMLVEGWLLGMGGGGVCVFFHRREHVLELGACPPSLVPHRVIVNTSDHSTFSRWGIERQDITA